MNDLAYAWFSSQYPFDSATCEWCLLSHRMCDNPAHIDLQVQVERLEMGLRDACKMDAEIRGARLVPDQMDSARKFQSLNDYLTKHYDEIVKLREIFKEYYDKPA